LQAKHPNAFLLLCQIARRARLTPCPVTGLQVRQAEIGDYLRAGIESEQAYRTAKKRLKACGFATFKGTNNGTIATLLDQGIFGLFQNEATDRATDQQRTNNEQTTTKIQRYNDTKKEYLSAEADEILKIIWNQTPPMGQQWSSLEKLKTAWVEIPAAKRPTMEIVMHALNQWCASEAWQKESGRWVPAIHNWIKDRKWENIPTNQTTSTSPKKLPWE
jgi:aspartate oxidase